MVGMPSAPGALLSVSAAQYCLHGRACYAKGRSNVDCRDVAPGWHLGSRFAFQYQQFSVVVYLHIVVAVEAM